MKIRFNGHNYQTSFKMAIRSRFSKWFGNYKWPVSVWVGHGDSCCDYWTTDPDEVIQATDLANENQTPAGASTKTPNQRKESDNV